MFWNFLLRFLLEKWKYEDEINWYYKLTKCSQHEEKKINQKKIKGYSSLWSLYKAGEHLSNKECQKITEILRLSLDTKS